MSRAQNSTWHVVVLSNMVVLIIVVRYFVAQSTRRGFVFIHGRSAAARWL